MTRIRNKINSQQAQERRRREEGRVYREREPMTTVREARVEAARDAIVKVHQRAAICRVEVDPFDLAVAVVDALFTDHSLDNIKTNG